MQKIVIILFIIICSCGCSVTRNSGKNNYSFSDINESSKLSERIKNNNLSNSSFFIEKADIHASGPEGDQKFLGSLKFELPDTYLISLRSISGFEVLRIYLTRDTLLINDRINKKLYYGRSQYLSEKYGIPVSILPLIFGDYLSTEIKDDLGLECKDGKVKLNSGINGIMIKYVIDCKKGKAISTSVVNSLNQESVKMNFTKFFGKETYMLPKSINIIGASRNLLISIRIVKAKLPFEGKIEFIPGSRYELVPLI